MTPSTTMEKLPAPPLPSWLAAMVPFERYRVAIGDGHVMHVMETGDPAGLPVVMVHGNPTWGFLYRRVATALAGEPLRIVLPDLIGLGFSDKPRDITVHTAENHGRWLVALLEELEIQRAVLVGQDWGGPIALLSVADHPERALGLVLMNTGVGPPREDFRPTPFHRLSHLPLLSDLLFRGLGFPLGLLALVQGDRASIRGAVARAYRYPLRRRADNLAPLALARMVPNSRQHPSVPALRRCEQVVRSFRGPGAIVWGERDPILGRACDRLAAMLPQARVTRTSAGHFLQEEVPDAIADAVSEVAQQAASGATAGR